MNAVLTNKYQLLRLQTIADLRGMIEDFGQLTDRAAADTAIAHTLKVLNSLD